MTRKILVGLLTIVACATGRGADPRGEVDRDQIRGAVRARMGEVQRCYDAVLAWMPGVAAGLVVDFTIGADGRVTRTAIEDLDGPEALGQCVASQVAAWTFPRPAHAIAVSYPFRFDPGGARS